MNDYIYIWRYVVRDSAVEEFILHYSPDGAWVALFRRGEGHLETRLLRSKDEANVFITIDRWTSREAFARFRELYAAEFEKLDQLSSLLTLEETEIGSFSELG